MVVVVVLVVVVLPVADVPIWRCLAVTKQQSHNHTQNGEG